MKSAIISGGSRGLGKALAIRMAEDGWNILTFSRNIEDFYNGKEGSIHTLRADMRLDRDILSVMETAKKLFGRTDLLIMNAGTISRCMGVLENTSSDLRRIFEVNVFANFFLMRTFLQENPEGMVVHVTSDAARHHFSGWGIYGASKNAMDFLVEAVATENSTIKICSIDPGDMDTEMHITADPGADRKSLQTPEEAAEKFYKKLQEVIRNE